jgi:Uma2 family endonuclease
MSDLPVRERKLKRVEYDRLVEAEVFGPEDRIELFDGRMIFKEPQYSPHATAISLVQRVLTSALGPAWYVRVQMPVALDDLSEPEPDVSVVPGHPRDYRDAHPERPALIVEVAQSRLRFDRRQKGSLYARAGVADYWIVNIGERQLEVYRDPVPDQDAPFGWRYGRRLTLGETDGIAPLAAPGATVAVSDLLP